MALGERNQVLGHDAHDAAAAIRAGHAAVVLHAELQVAVHEVRGVRDGVEHGAQMLGSVVAQNRAHRVQFGQSAVYWACRGDCHSGNRSLVCATLAYRCRRYTQNPCTPLFRSKPGDSHPGTHD